MKTEAEILDELRALPGQARWVVYSGGNPALLDLELLTAYLIDYGYSVMIETQGTVWKDWMRSLDEVCVSPKPPSSQNETDFETTATFLEKFNGMSSRVYLKVPIFDLTDYAYAAKLRTEFPYYDMFVSVGNSDPTLPTVGNPTPRYKATLKDTQTIVLNKTRWLMELVASDPQMRDVRVLPQIHVLAWGNQRGR